MRVLLRGAMEAVRRGGFLASLAMLRDVAPAVRLHFLVAAHRLGLLCALAERPASLPELAGRLEVERPELLEILLGIGVQLGELRRRGDAYSLRGRRARALAGPAGDVLSALLEELVLYHALVYRDLPGLARGAAAPDYLADAAAIVARSSRVAEPFIGAWLREVLRGLPPGRLLDMGCGSGVYLRIASGASPDVRGVGVDLQPEVVGLARRNLEQWGIADRFEVAQGDVRSLLDTLGGGFGAILASNNTYYFTPEERVELFTRLRSALAPGGALLVVSLFKGSGLTTRDLDLVLAATPGCCELAALDDVLAELSQAGFADLAVQRLAPDLSGVVAR